MGKNYCRNCVRFYSTGADQCEVPNRGITEVQKEMNNPNPSESEIKKIMFKKAVHGDRMGARKLTSKDFKRALFFVQRAQFINIASSKKVFGHPSELNYDNTCPYYKGLWRPFRWLTGFVRMFH